MINIVFYHKKIRLNCFRLAILFLLLFTISYVAYSQDVQYKPLSDGVVRYYKETSDKSPWLYGLYKGFRKLFDEREPPFGKSVAFLVGISHYENITPQLPFVKNDIEDMRKFLLEAGGFDEVYVAMDEIANRDLIEEYIKNKFPKLLKEEDRLLFYYAGHGADSGGRTGYMQFSKAKPNDFVGPDVLAINDSKDWFEEVDIKHFIAIFDACASGLAFTPRGDNDDKTNLRNTLSGNGSRIVVTAGTADEKTYEVKGPSGRGNGVFTRSFLNALTDGAADKEKDGFMTIGEIMVQVEKEVAHFLSEYNRKMTPRVWETDPAHYRGTFVFITKNIDSSNNSFPPIGTIREPLKRSPELTAVPKLITQSRSLLENGRPELSAILARQAYNFNREYPVNSDQVRERLHAALSYNYFNTTIKDASDGLYAIASDQSSGLLATGGRDNKLRIYDTKKQSLPMQELERTPSWISDIVFGSQRQNFLISADWTGAVKLWKLEGVPKILDEKKYHKSDIALALNSSNSILASGGWDNTLLLHLISNDKLELVKKISISEEMPTHIYSIAFSRDGSLLAVGSSDSLLRVWNVPDLVSSSDSNPIAILDLPEQPHSIVFSNKYIFAGMSGRGVLYWNIHNFNSEPGILGDLDFSRPANRGAVAVSSDNTLLAVGRSDYRIELWDINDFDKKPRLLPRSHKYVIYDLAFLGPNRLTSVSLDNSAKIWDLGLNTALAKYLSYERLLSLSYRKLSSPTMAYLPNGVLKVAGAGYQQNSANQLVVLQEGEIERLQKWTLDVQVRAVSIGQTSGKIYGATLNKGYLRVWNTQDNEVDKYQIPGDWSKGSQISAIAVSPSEEIFAWGGNSPTVKLWDIKKPREDIRTLTLGKGGISSIAFNRKNNLLAVGGSARLVKIWDISAEPKLITTSPEHDGEVTALYFDGSLLITGTEYGTVSIWRVSQTGEINISTEYRTKEFYVRAVLLSPNDKKVLAYVSPRLSTGYGELISWTTETGLADIICGRVTQNLTKDEWVKFVGKDIDYQCTCDNLPPCSKE